MFKIHNNSLIIIAKSKNTQYQMIFHNHTFLNHSTNVVMFKQRVKRHGKMH